MGEWMPFGERTTAHKAPCIQCGVVSSWHPLGWVFRHTPIKGAGIHGPKVSSQRLGPACQEHVGATIEWIPRSSDISM